MSTIRLNLALSIDMPSKFASSIVHRWNPHGPTQVAHAHAFTRHHSTQTKQLLILNWENFNILRTSQYPSC